MDNNKNVLALSVILLVLFSGVLIYLMIAHKYDSETDAAKEAAVNASAQKAALVQQGTALLQQQAQQQAQQQRQTQQATAQQTAQQQANQLQYMKDHDPNRPFSFAGGNGPNQWGQMGLKVLPLALSFI